MLLCAKLSINALYLLLNDREFDDTDNIHNVVNLPLYGHRPQTTDKRHESFVFKAGYTLSVVCDTFTEYTLVKFETTSSTHDLVI